MANNFLKNKDQKDPNKISNFQMASQNSDSIRNKFIKDRISNNVDLKKSQMLNFLKSKISIVTDSTHNAKLIANSP